MPTEQEVSQFLNDVKAAIRLGYVHWIDRADSKKAPLSGLKISVDQALHYLMALTAEDYCRGPDPDDFKPDREVWCFGCNVVGVDAYIKLALQPDSRRRTVVYVYIWAFHKAEYPLTYPLRGKP